MSGGLHTETLLAAGYALFLIVAAIVLDLLARHAQHRAERYRTGGFSYSESVDAWECPEGEHLHRVETDQKLRTVRYRARAHVCNSCRLKDTCTDSDEGREIVESLDPWPHSEAGRFHRGIAVVMVALAALILAAAAALHHGIGDLAVLGGAVAVTAATGLYLIADFRETSSGFPWRYGEQSGAAPAPTPSRSPPTL
jgi:hypothetical protein